MSYTTYKTWDSIAKKKKRSILLEQKSNYLFNCTMDKIEYIAQETLLKKKIK